MATAYGRKLIHAFMELNRLSIEEYKRDNPHDGRARGGDIWVCKRGSRLTLIISQGINGNMFRLSLQELWLIVYVEKDGKWEFTWDELNQWLKDNDYVFVGYLADFIRSHDLYDAVLTATGDMPTDDDSPEPVIEIYPTMTSALDAVFDESSNAEEE